MTRLTLESMTWVAALALAAACGPKPSETDGGTDGGTYDAGYCAQADHPENVSACTPLATDYRPRAGVPGANGWPACISDDNTWHLIGTGLPAAVARSVAFETMGTKLWHKAGTPTKDDFLSARDDYSVASGLASRVVRRQDVHYPEVPGTDKFACSNAGIPEQYPDRCAGPAKLKPLIDDAFQKGLAEQQPLVQAARIEAALLWFFYLSMTSEVWTCSFSDLADCDSASGYYSQLRTRSDPAGLGRYVAALGPETHHRIHDALLAERCWRDVDSAMPASSQYLFLYDRALAQLDTATLRGLGLILRARIGWVACTTGEAQLAHMEFVKVLGGLLDHQAVAIDATQAAKLKAFTGNPTGDESAVASAQAAIDALFACP